MSLTGAASRVTTWSKPFAAHDYTREDTYRQTRAPVPDGEIIAHGFFGIEALPNDTTTATRARIIEVLGGASVSQRW